MRTVTIKIYDGPHYTDRVAKEYYSNAAIDTIIEGARVKCGQLIATKGKRVWVDFTGENYAPITHRIFQEG